MNAQNIYTCAAEIIRACIIDDQHNSMRPERRTELYKEIINNPLSFETWPAPVGPASSILYEARKAMETKTTTAGALAAMKRRIATSPDRLRGQFEQNGNWYIVDGFSLYRSEQKFPATIPEIRSDFNAERVLPDLNRYHAAPATVTRAALKEWKARPENKPIKRGYKGKAFAIEEEAQRIGVDPDFLYDAMTVYPEAAVMVSTPFQPILLVKDSSICALVMPVRVDQPARKEAKSA